MLSSARIAASRNSLPSGGSELMRDEIIQVRVAASRTCGSSAVARSSDSGGSTALTRLPSGRRASTIGEASSTRRPTWATILLMIRRRWCSSVKRTPVFSSRPPRSTQTSTGAVDHDLGDGVVLEQRLDRPVTERVVGDLLRQPVAVGGGEPALLREPVADIGQHDLAQCALRQRLVVEPGPELGDDRHVDPVLELDERVGPEPGRPPNRHGCLLPASRSRSSMTAPMPHAPAAESPTACLPRRSLQASAAARVLLGLERLIGRVDEQVGQRVERLGGVGLASRQRRPGRPR